MKTISYGDLKVCSIGSNDTLTLELINNTITVVNGPDLYVFEMGEIEPSGLEISKDGKEWIDIGHIEGGRTMVNIEPFVPKGVTFTYVRLTNLITYSALTGADIDAIGAIGGALQLNLDSDVLFDTGECQLKKVRLKNWQNS